MKIYGGIYGIQQPCLLAAVKRLAGISGRLDLENRIWRITTIFRDSSGEDITAIGLGAYRMVAAYKLWSRITD